MEYCQWISKEEHFHSRQLEVEELDGDENSIYIIAIQKDVIITPDLRAKWEKTYHLNLSHYLHTPSTISGTSGGGFFIVHIAPDALKEIMSSNPFITNAILLPREWKESPILSEGIRKENMGRGSKIADFSVLKVILLDGVVSSKEEASRVGGSWSEYFLNTFPSTQEKAISVTAETPTLIMVKNVEAEQLVQVIEYLSRQSQIYWIEPSILMYLHNNEGNALLQNGLGRFDLSALGITQPFLHAAGIKGEGQIVGCADSGLDVNHCMFSNKPDAADQPLVSSGKNNLFPNNRKVIQYIAYADNLEGEVAGHG
jgi:hypothetical protein